MKQQIEPKVSPGDWITIGTKKVVVCAVDKCEGIEVVYSDCRNRAINDNVIWKNNCWEFKAQSPSGGYADKYPRLSEYMAILRHGRYKN